LSTRSAHFPQNLDRAMYTNTPPNTNTSYNQKLWIAKSIKAAYPWGEYKPKNSGDTGRRKDTPC
jgi:hypothetical protein